MRKRKRKIIKLLFSLTNSLKSKDSSFTIINNKENQQTHSRSWNQQSKNIFALRQFIDYQNNCTLIFFWLTKQFTMAAHQINPDIIIQFGKKKEKKKTFLRLQLITPSKRCHCWPPVVWPVIVIYRCTLRPQDVTVGCGYRCSRAHLWPHPAVMLGVMKQAWNLHPAEQRFSDWL